MRVVLALMLFSALNLNAQTPKQQDGVEVSRSRLLLLPASTVERSAAQQYSQLMRAAAQKNALNADKMQTERLRNIARKLIPQSARFNKDAAKWKWEVNLISSNQVNAFCMPGGKIAFFTGILDQLRLTDDEVAMVMGHEIGHALLEHGRARMSQEYLKIAGISIAASVFNLGQLSTELLGQAATVAVSLPYARKQESDSDLVGMELGARAGYDPRAAVVIWQKMQKLAQASKSGAPPQMLSTHPSNENRIRDIQAALPRVTPLYEAAKGARK